MTERRAKIVYLDPLDILHAVVGFPADIKPGTRIAFRNVKLPEGATVRDVHYDFQRAQFGVIVEHESFYPTQPGMVLEVMETNWIQREIVTQ